MYAYYNSLHILASTARQPHEVILNNFWVADALRLRLFGHVRRLYGRPATSDCGHVIRFIPYPWPASRHCSPTTERMRRVEICIPSKARKNKEV